MTPLSHLVPPLPGFTASQTYAPWPVWSSRTLGIWMWASVIQPLLERPAWLVPASAGLVLLLAAALALVCANTPLAIRHSPRMFGRP